jgi:hypothetical protein
MPAVEATTGQGVDEWHPVEDTEAYSVETGHDGPRSHLPKYSRVGVDIGGYRSITGSWRGGVLVRLAVQAVGHDEDEGGMVEKRDE